MKYPFRGSLRNSKEVVDIIRFDGRIAKCGDSKDRDIDEFNTIFYPAQSFKKDILNIEEVESIKETISEEPKIKKSK